MPAARLLTTDDVLELARLLTENRAFLAPWDPIRDDEFYSVAGQRAAVEGLLAQYQAGLCYPCVIVNEEGQLVGRTTLSGIERGAFQSGRLGYWLSESANGRGLATAAVAEMKRIAFRDLGLHRIEAGTLLHNLRSQRVLERNGFRRYGTAPAYCKIAGHWQDHALYQVLSAER